MCCFKNGTEPNRIKKSRFINGYTNQNGSDNYYHDLSSGITLITYSPKDPSRVHIKIKLVNVTLHNNIAKMGNLYIEHNSCTTGVHVKSRDSGIGIHIRPQLWRSAHCTILAAWGISIVEQSSFSNTSLYFTVPKEDGLKPDDLLETQNPDLEYIHLIGLYNISVVNSDAEITFFVSFVYKMLLTDMIFENNEGADLMMLINTEVQLQNQCIFKRNSGGITAYYGTRLIFAQDSDIQVFDSQDDVNAPLVISYAYVEVQSNSIIIHSETTVVH